jgi:GTP cyclohydrolase I
VQFTENEFRVYGSFAALDKQHVLGLSELYETVTGFAPKPDFQEPIKDSDYETFM